MVGLNFTKGDIQMIFKQKHSELDQESDPDRCDPLRLALMFVVLVVIFFSGIWRKIYSSLKRNRKRRFASQ